MKTKIAINGFGRIGRSAFKIAFERPDLEVVAINDLTDTKTLAYLLKHDSNYGTYQRKVEFNETNLIIDGTTVRVLAEPEPAKLPWRKLGAQVVIESTGRFTDPGIAKVHIEAGAAKVIISAPAKGEAAETIVLGVNDDELNQAGDIISNASCTTNCITPVMAILESHFGIEKAMMTTVHSYTNSQRLLDAPAKDLREARSAATNIVPTTTGASTAASRAMPKLAGIFGGLSIRVPTPVVSLSDFVVVCKRAVTVEEVNEVFLKAAQEPFYQGILATTDEPLVSSDFIGNSHSAIIDLSLTAVVGDTLLKVVAWYDNEWGYANRLVELTADTARLLSKEEKTGSETIKSKDTDSKPLLEAPEREPEAPKNTLPKASPNPSPGGSIDGIRHF
ncbi:MAG: type I glyceraldehyde-3-phosphate dehydrogenase [Candidatus Saccharimonadales bacterium]